MIVRSHGVVILPRSISFGHAIILNGFVIDKRWVHLWDGRCNIKREWRAILCIKDTVYKALTVNDLLKEWVL